MFMTAMDLESYVILLVAFCHIKCGTSEQPSIEEFIGSEYEEHGNIIFTPTPPELPDEAEVCRPQAATRKYPRDCYDIAKSCKIPKSGVFTIQPMFYQSPFDVYCDHDSEGSGWTVIQRRKDGTIDFDLGWESYRTGFGNILSEFWLGNEKIHYLTMQQDYQLVISIVDDTGKDLHASYTKFAVAEESLQYKLVVKGYKGNLDRDSFSSQNGMKFSANDTDNDTDDVHHCAKQHYLGGWWYSKCGYSNLNGIPGERTEKGIVWFGADKQNLNIQQVEMRIRPNL